MANKYTCVHIFLISNHERWQGRKCENETYEYGPMPNGIDIFFLSLSFQEESNKKIVCLLVILHQLIDKQCERKFVERDK